MKKTILSKTILLALTCVTGSALATTTSFDMHGYIKSGLLANSDGTRAQSLSIIGDGKWRLGNEQNTKIELLPTMNLTTDEGVIARVKSNLTHETNSSADWNNTDGDGHDVQFREGYIELENLDFAPGVVFWAGKRYSSSNTSSHQYDWEYIQYNGTGGGADKIDLGFARLDVGVYAFTPTSDNSNIPEDSSRQGYPEDYSLNVWLKEVGGSKIDLQFVGHHMEEREGAPNDATHGLGFTGVYNFDGFYGLGNGYSRITFQYGEGLAGGDSLGKNGWGWANNNNTKSWRTVFDGLVNLDNQLDVSTFAYYQDDTDYAPWSHKAEGQGDHRQVWAIGVRPFQQITDNFAMQYEVGYEHFNNKTTGVDGGMTKFTVAPTLTFESGFWTRPQIRVFATYAKWDDSINDRLDSSYTRNGDTTTLNFGIQGEVWF